MKFLFLFNIRLILTIEKYIIQVRSPEIYSICPLPEKKTKKISLVKIIYIVEWISKIILILGFEFEFPKIKSKTFIKYAFMT